MKKKITVIMAMLLVFAGFTAGAMSKGLVEKIEAELRGDFEIVIDGKKETFKNVQGEEVYPILYNGTTYLPVRAIGELMGKTVYWYQDEKRIELVDEKEGSLVTDADVIVDGSGKEKPVKPQEPDKEKPEAEVEITLEEAKEIALEKAGLEESEVKFTKGKLDFDDNKVYYELEFKAEKVKYDAEIDAMTGKILEWEIDKKDTAEDEEDKITLEEAKKIALKKADLKEKDVIFTKAELDYDDGKAEYEIEFDCGTTEYEVTIDAVTGEITEFEKDIDD